jgi:hypothetical protein
MFDPAGTPDPEFVYANYLKTCAMCGIEPTPREQALGFGGLCRAAVVHCREATDRTRPEADVRALLNRSFLLTANPGLLL